MTPNSLLYPCPSCQRGVCTYNKHSNSAVFVLLGVHEFYTLDQLVSPQVNWVSHTPQIKMEDYVKILLLKTLGQSFSVTSKSLFGKARGSECFNRMCFPFNECKRGHRKGLKANNMWVSAVCHGPIAPPTTAVWTTAGYPEHPSLLSLLSSNLHFGPQRRPPATEPKVTETIIPSVDFPFP